MSLLLLEAGSVAIVKAQEHFVHVQTNDQLGRLATGRRVDEEQCLRRELHEAAVRLLGET